MKSLLIFAQGGWRVCLLSLWAHTWAAAFLLPSLHELIVSRSPAWIWERCLCLPSDRATVTPSYPYTHKHTLWTPASAPDRDWPAAVSHHRSVIHLCVQKTTHFSKQHLAFSPQTFIPFRMCIVVPCAIFFYIFLPLVTPGFISSMLLTCSIYVWVCSCPRPL